MQGLGPKGDDMATEAGSQFGNKYEEPEFEIKRREPPKLAEYHAWGVEEGWGKKAGRWGKGASVFRKEEE
jgi:hypothetical protein